MDILYPTSPDSHAWLTEAKKLASLSLPIIFTNLGQVAIQTTDVVMIGWLGPEPLAASALGANVYFVLLLFAIGVLTATSPMMAQELGRCSYAVREPRRTARQGFWLALAIGLPACVLLWRIDLILHGLRQAPELIELAVPYARAALWGFIPALGFMVLRNFISALERPGPATAVSLVAVLFNIGANYVLIFGALGMRPLGLFGAGIATALTEFFLFAGLVLIVLNDRRFRRYQIFGRFWRPDWARFREIWRLGLPIALGLVMEIGLFASSGFLMGWIGTVELAAHQIALQCATVTFMVPLGLSQAATVRVGLALGRKDPDGVFRAGTGAVGLGVLFMGAVAVVMVSIPDQIVRIFLDDASAGSQSVAALAASFLVIAALFQVFDGGQVIGAGALRGLKDTTIPMLYAAIAYWVVGLSASAGLGFGLGLEGFGIWTGLALALGVASVLMVGRFVILQRQLKAGQPEKAGVLV
jgi:MATE family multidrug resistance protein